MKDNIGKRICGPSGLFFATLTVLIAPNVWLSVCEPMGWAARLANVLLPGGLYVLLMTVFRNQGRMVWGVFVLLFLSAFQLVLLYLYGHSIIAVDMFLNLVTTNSAEVGELLGSLLPAVIGVVVVFLPILIVASCHLRDAGYVLEAAFRRRVRTYGAVTAAAGAVMTAVAYMVGPYAIVDDMYPFNVGYNICLAAQRTGLAAEREAASADFSFGACSTHADSIPEIYVMVVGETARAENFGLFGYERDTTPLLSSTSGLIAFPKAFTQSNTTHKSVPMLLSAATADDFDRLYREKGVLTAFREAGFHTVFLSNQRRNHSFIDLLGEEADTCRFLKEEMPEGDMTLDGALVDELGKIVAEGHRKLFVVLHTYGSHFKYHERYPRATAVFTPDEVADVKASNREQLVNAYDNTIRYTDSVLHSLIECIDSTGAAGALVYTSDHGENIFDDNRGLFLHASPRPSAHELHVPMIAWLSPDYEARYVSVGENLRRNAAERVLTSASMFHTMLDIAGIDTPFRADSLSVASASYRPGEYHYLTDRNIPVPVEKAMLR
ncbi:MAG: lipid A phosphoethanolamine transferase [Duncaniella sp.]|nr:lipid A phosphoethanolamine transferase [Duncaniella sp.]